MKSKKAIYILGGIGLLWLSAIMLFMMVEITRMTVEIIMRTWL